MLSVNYNYLPQPNRVYYNREQVTSIEYSFTLNLEPILFSLYPNQEFLTNLIFYIGVTCRLWNPLLTPCGHQYEPALHFHHFSRISKRPKAQSVCVTLVPNKISIRHMFEPLQLSICDTCSFVARKQLDNVCTPEFGLSPITLYWQDKNDLGQTCLHCFLQELGFAGYIALSHLINTICRGLQGEVNTFCLQTGLILRTMLFMHMTPTYKFPFSFYLMNCVLSFSL